MRLYLISIVIGLLAAVPVQAQPSAEAQPTLDRAAHSSIPRLIPTADLARQPTFTGPMLSPDGKHMIARFAVGGRARLGVHSFDGKPLKMLAVPERTDLRWYRWAGNDRILISLARTTISLRTRWCRRDLSLLT